MSKLAASLAEVRITKPAPAPRASCFPLYGGCDMEDMEAVQRLRDDQIPWAEVQKIVDDLLGIKEGTRINNRRFVRHWKAECSCPMPSENNEDTSNV